MQQAIIQIQGHLDSQWMEWLDGLEFTYTESGDTILIGCIPDQAALYGLIARLRDLGIKIISMTLDPP